MRMGKCMGKHGFIGCLEARKEAAPNCASMRRASSSGGDAESHGLELNDIVDVKYKNIEKLVGKTVMIADLKNDGKIDAKDLELAKAKAVGFFGTALPSASGLAAGIMIGLKI